MKCLHLGCGNIRLEGFINVDIRNTAATDLVMDITSLSDFNDNSIDMIYTSHCLEHFSFRITLDILREWNRVLKKDGVLTIRVPDFDILINTYLKRRDVEILELLNILPAKGYIENLRILLMYLFLGKGGTKDRFYVRIRRIWKWLFQPERRTLSFGLLGTLLGGQDYPENYHKSFFNEKYLRELLCEAGFKNVKCIKSCDYPADNHRDTLGLSCCK